MYLWPVIQFKILRPYGVHLREHRQGDIKTSYVTVIAHFKQSRLTLTPRPQVLSLQLFVVSRRG